MTDKKNTASILAKIRQKMQRIEKPEDQKEDSVAVVELTAPKPDNSAAASSENAGLENNEKSNILDDDDIFLREIQENPIEQTAPKMENAAINKAPENAEPENAAPKNKIPENVVPTPAEASETASKSNPPKAENSIDQPEEELELDDNLNPIQKAEVKNQNDTNPAATTATEAKIEKDPMQDLATESINSSNKKDDLDVEFSQAIESSQNQAQNSDKLTDFDDLDSINLDEIDKPASTDNNIKAQANKEEDSLDLDLDKIEIDDIKDQNNSEQKTENENQITPNQNSAPILEATKKEEVILENSNQKNEKENLDHSQSAEEHHNTAETELHELDDLDELLTKPVNKNQNISEIPAAKHDEELNQNHEDDFLYNHGKMVDHQDLDHDLNHDLGHDFELDQNHQDDIFSKQTTNNFSNLETNIISQKVANQATNSIKNLINAVPKKHEILNNSPAFHSGETIENMVMNILTPKLQQWCDENLGMLVEKVVREEIKKLIPKD